MLFGHSCKACVSIGAILEDVKPGLYRKLGDDDSRSSSFTVINDFKEITTFLPNYNQLLDKAGIRYADVISAEECGLIDASPSLLYRMPINQCLFRNKTFVITTETEDYDSVTLDINQFPLTAVGKEISALCAVDENNDFS